MFVAEADVDDTKSCGELAILLLHFSKSAGSKKIHRYGGILCNQFSSEKDNRYVGLSKQAIST
jgi:hypothetical protein